MATLVLSAAGSYLGGLVGGTIGSSIGFAVGSLLGNSLQKLPGQEGPRLSDLKVTGSTYGTHINKLYGQNRINGSIIWSTDNVEVSHTEKQGGKGGPSQSVTSYSYYGNFAVLLCEGPIIAITKIWADSVLLFDVSSADVEAHIGSSELFKTLTIYYGDETQEPDPLIESYEGAGMVPAHRGSAYLVFNELPIDKFGRLPNITAEVIKNGSFDDSTVLRIFDTRTPVLSHSSWGYSNGVISTGQWGANTFTERKYNLDYEIISEIAYPVTIPTAVSGHLCINNPDYYAIGVGVGLNRVEFFYRDTKVNIDSFQGGSGTTALDGSFAYLKIGSAEYIYAIGGHDGGVVRYSIDSGSKLPDPIQPLLFTELTNFALGHWLDIFENKIYLGWYDGTDFWVTSLDTDLNILDTWAGFNGSYSQKVAITRNPYTQELVAIANISNGNYRGYILNDDFTTAATTTISGNNNGVLILGNGLAAIENKILAVFNDPTASPPTLSSVVSEICIDAGLVAGELNVSSLTDTVDGFVITRQMNARAAIDVLRPAYRFDMIESDGKIKAVNRGGAAVYTISENDLAAHIFGQQTPDSIVVNRKQETELPRRVSIAYINKDDDYQQNIQSFERIVTESKNVSSIELPIVLTDDEAAQIANVLSRNEWTERDAYTFTLPLDYIDLDVADPINLPFDGDTVKVRTLSLDNNGAFLGCRAVRDDTGYSSTVSGGAASGITAAIAALAGDTLYHLLDINMLRDDDNSNGFYIAGAGYLAGWEGAIVYTSSDGDDYGNLASILSPSFIGASTDVLASGTTNRIDKVNTVNVTLATNGAALSSITESQLLSGGNPALLGNEIIQFQTATLESDGTYTLSNLLRSRRGSEQGTHVIGDRFIFLDESKLFRVKQDNSLIDALRYYKAVTVGDYLQNTDAVSFTNTGTALKPYAPVYVKGSRDGSNNLTITWFRRSRISARAFWSPTLAEDSESYEIDIIVAGSPEIVRTITSTSETASYTAAQQTTDGITPGDLITMRIYQLSATFGRGYTREVTL